MAKIYLEGTESADFVIANNGTNIKGTSSVTDSIAIAADVTGVIVDSTIEQIDLSGSIADYTFEKAASFGTGFNVYNAEGVKVFNFTVNSDKALSFSEGTVAVTYTDSTIFVGGTAITTTAAAVVPATIDADNVSSVVESAPVVVDPETPTTNEDIAVSQGDILAAGGDIIPVNVGNTGTTAVTIASSIADADLYAKVLISGDADATITSGSGNDTIFIEGAGNKTVNLGTGADKVYLGAGDDTVIIGDAAFGVPTTVNSVDYTSVISGGTGVNTIQVTGTNDLENGTLTNIQKLIIEDASTITMQEGTAAAFDSIVVNGTTSEIVLEDTSTTPETNYDLTNMSGTLAKLTIEASVIITLDADLLSNITEIAGAGTVSTSIDGAIAAQDITYSDGAAVATTISINDTIENIIARGSELSDVTITLTEDVDVAGAIDILASGLTVEYNLVDTAANLALASTIVFDSAANITASTVATAAQAASIDTTIDSSTFTVSATNTVFDVTDTASMLANYAGGLAHATNITANTAATIDEADAIFGADTDTVTAVFDYAIEDVAGVIGNTLAGTDLTAANAASSVTITDVATMAEVKDANDTLTGTVEDGYSIADSYANIITGASVGASAANAEAIADAAGDITENNAGLTITEANTIENTSNTGTNSYELDDAANYLLGASTAVTTNTTSVSVTDASITVARMNALETKFSDKLDFIQVAASNVTVEGTISELTGLSTAALDKILDDTEVELSVTASTTATIAEIVALDAKLPTGLALPTYAISDSLTAIEAGVLDEDELAILEGAASIDVNTNATVEQITDLNTALAVDGGGLNAVNTYNLSDSAANLVAGGAATVVNGSTNITVEGDTSLTQLDTILEAYGDTSADADLAVNVTYSIKDTADNLVGDDGLGNAIFAVTGTNDTTNTLSEYLTNASTITLDVTDVIFAQATALSAITAFDGTYAIVDTVANLYQETAAGDVTVLNAATDVKVQDSLTALKAANGLTAIGLDTTDTVEVLETALTNFHTAGAINTTNFPTSLQALVDNIVISTTAADANVANDVTAIKNLTALGKDFTYPVTGSYAELTAGGDDLNAMILNATTVTIDTTPADVAKYNEVDALTNGTTIADVTDTIENLAATDAATAISSALAASATVTVSDVASATATVAQLETLVERGLTTEIDEIDVADTAAAISAMTDAAWAITAGAEESFTVTDNGILELSAARAQQIYEANGTTYDTDGSSYGNYSIVDDGANVVATNGILGTGFTDLIGFSQGVTINDAINIDQANTLAALTSMGEITFDIEDSADDLVGATSSISAEAGIDAAQNITVTGTVAVDQAVALNAATNTGTTTYDISATAATLALDATNSANDAAIAAIEAATTVTVSDNSGKVSATDATILAAYDVDVVYHIEHNDAEALAASTGLAEAENIELITDTATVAEANTIMAAANSGTTVLLKVEGTADEIATLAPTGDNDTITTLSVTGTVTAAAAKTINDALDASVTNAIVFEDIVGTAEEIALLPDAVLAAVTGGTNGVVVTETMTVAQYDTLAAAVTISNIDEFSLTDSFENLMEDNDVDGTVNADTAITNATTVTVTDSSLTVAQAAALYAINNAAVYSIVDNDENIINAMTTAKAELLLATTVKGYNDVALTIEDIGGTAKIVGTKTNLDLLSDELQDAQLVYEVSVQDINDNSAFYTALEGNQAIRVTDSYENLISSATVSTALAVVVDGDVTMTEAAEMISIAGAAAGGLTYSLNDLPANLTAGATLSSAATVTADGTVSLTQATVLSDRTAASQTNTTYSIEDADTAFADYTTDGATSFAQDITVTGTAGVTHSIAQVLLSETNAGTTTIALVTGSSANLAGLTVGTNDTITSVTPSDAATVVELTAIEAYAGSITAYSISDDNDEETGITTATEAQLNAATDITVTAAITVAQATTIDTATNSGTNTYQIEDDAEAILAATAAILETDASGTITITDTTIDAATATLLEALDAANDNITIHHGAAAGAYKISDTSANILDTANATVVGAATSVAVENVVNIATADLVLAEMATATYSISDTYANTAASANLATTNAAIDVTVTGNLLASQAGAVAGFTNTGDTVYNITDSGTNLAAASAAVVNAAATVTLNGTATVAQAAIISEFDNVTYSITDSATAIYDAINTINDVDAEDRETIEGAETIVFNAAATIAQITGDEATEKRGLGGIDGLAYDIEDTPDLIAAALNDTTFASTVTAASTVSLTDTTGASVADMTTIQTVLGASFVGHDVGGGEEYFYLLDTANTLSVSDSALVAAAQTVTINDTSVAAGDLSVVQSMTTTVLAANTNVTDLEITGLAGTAVAATNLVDTFVFAAGDTGVTITEFDEDTADLLDLDLVMADANGGSEVAYNGTANATAGDIITYNVANAALDATGIQALFVDTFAGGVMGLADGDEIILFNQYGTDDITTQIINITGANGATDTIQIVGTVTTNTAAEVLDINDIA